MKKSNVKKSTSTKTSSTKTVGTSTKRVANTSTVKSSSTEAKSILEAKEKSTITLNKPLVETAKPTSCEAKKTCAAETVAPAPCKAKEICTDKKDTVNFTFKVNNKTSYFGEKLYVCGNLKELGNWDVKNSFNLTTDENLYPSWKGTITLPIDTYIEFKFVSVGSDGETENVIWEDGENRAATITKDSNSYESDWNEK